MLTHVLDDEEVTCLRITKENSEMIVALAGGQVDYETDAIYMLVPSKGGIRQHLYISWGDYLIHSRSAGFSTLTEETYNTIFGD